MDQSSIELSKILEGAVNEEGSPLAFENGVWLIRNKVNLLQRLERHFFIHILDEFKEIAIQVLRECNPLLNYPKEERLTQSLWCERGKYSEELRKGITEGIAILGNNENLFSRCAPNQIQNYCCSIISILLKDNNWKKWASLNRNLPELAEAAPITFLNLIEKQLNSEACVFDELFKQEGNVFQGDNYLIGLLSALERLAWDCDYFSRVCIVLAKLARRDPGGNYGNRPAHVLQTILLPWFPQTMASSSQRISIFKNLFRVSRPIAWEILLNLLPNQVRSSSGTEKPVWRNLSLSDQKNEVSSTDAYAQMCLYANLAVKKAKGNIEWLVQLIVRFESLPFSTAKDLMKALSTKSFLNKINDEDCVYLWKALTQLIVRLRKKNIKEEAFKNMISQLEDLVINFEPKNLYNSCNYLFSNYEADLFQSEDYEKEQGRLLKKRKEALLKILDTFGVEGIIQFALKVKFPEVVGETLAAITTNEIEHFLLPLFLENSEKAVQNFIVAFISVCYNLHGEKWLKNIDLTSWSEKQTLTFLLALQFKKATWDRVKSCLSKSEKQYWKNVIGNVFYISTVDEFEFCINKLTYYNRPYEALRLSALYYSVYNNPINANLCCTLFEKAQKSKENISRQNIDSVENLIVILQKTSMVDKERLFAIEFYFLPLLLHRHNIYPKTVEERLAESPEFFCEVLSQTYRSKKRTRFEKESSFTRDDKQKQGFAKNMFSLLHHWKTPPGLKNDGSFDERLFLKWLAEVKKLCKRTGHLTVALITIGGVLIHVPSSKKCWINISVAKILDEESHSKMREGFYFAMLNSRGVHMVDPSGTPEKELARQFREKASIIDEKGYVNFATTLRAIATNYENEAMRIQREFLPKQCK